MKINSIETIKDLKLIVPDIFYDFRGEYAETYNNKDWNLGIEFIQDDISVSSRNVLRGLHGDAVTWKLVQCLHGSLYLVVVDCRKDSYTYSKWYGYTLNDKNRHQILIPPGCANGYLCLSDSCIFHYKQSTYYQGADKQFTLRWNAVKAVFWPISNPILSSRDSNGASMGELS